MGEKVLFIRLRQIPRTPKISYAAVWWLTLLTSSSSKLGVTEQHFCSNLLNYSVNLLLNKIVC